MATRYNAQMSHRQVRAHCRLDADGDAMLKSAMDELGFSARAHDKILRIARTIADLASDANLCAHHISEAVNYRTLDRRLWT